CASPLPSKSPTSGVAPASSCRVGPYVSGGGVMGTPYDCNQLRYVATRVNAVDSPPHMTPHDTRPINRRCPLCPATVSGPPLSPKHGPGAVNPPLGSPAHSIVAGSKSMSYWL